MCIEPYGYGLKKLSHLSKHNYFMSFKVFSLFSLKWLFPQVEHNKTDTIIVQNITE